MLGLLEYITGIPVNEEVLTRGLRTKYRDFEDSIQVCCATSVEKIECIVTRNIKDFKGSKLSVLAPDDLCAKF